MRLIVLLLAAVFVTAAAGQAASASGAIAGTVIVIEDVCDLEPVTVPIAVAVPDPGLPPPLQLDAHASPERGRTHAVLVFRPPR